MNFQLNYNLQRGYLPGVESEVDVRDKILVFHMVIINIVGVNRTTYPGWLCHKTISN